MVQFAPRREHGPVSSKKTDRFVTFREIPAVYFEKDMRNTQIDPVKGR